MIDYSRIPPITLESLEAWVNHGQLPGSFLQSVLENDFCFACVRASDDNAKALQDIARWLVDKAPLRCWGSPERVRDWPRKMRELREKGMAVR